MKKLFRKLVNRETILYIVFGVLTTLVDLGVLELMILLCGEELILLNNAVAFVAAVLCAFFVNKLFVFESKSWKPSVAGVELLEFFGARLFSFGLEELGLWIAKVPLHAGSYSLWGIDGIRLAKYALMILVLILNYVFSKLWIFKKERQ